MSAQQSTLETIYENWASYNAKLRAAVAPLTAEQLTAQPAPHMWPLGQILQHIVSVRAGWFSGTLQDEDETMGAYMEWGQRESPWRDGARPTWSVRSGECGLLNCDMVAVGARQPG